VPVAPWLGHLELPPGSERDPHGAVPCRLRSVPPEWEHLLGATVWLAWRPSWAVVENLLDFEPSPLALKAARWGMKICTALRGWRRVSPLESIAAAFGPAGVLVRFEPHTMTAGPTGLRITLNTAPVQVAGTHVGRVRFEQGAGPDNTCSVRFFDRHAGDFAAQPVRVRHVPIGGPRGMPFPRVTLTQIEHSPLNPAGWHVYGSFAARGEFVIAALEPCALMLPPTATAHDAAHPPEGVAGLWQGPKNEARQIVLGDGARLAAGQSFLVMHLSWGARPSWRYLLQDWHWNVASALPLLFKAARLLRLDFGHASLGLARRVPDPLTGGERLQVVYKQSFLPNVLGNTSLDQDWHVYAGSLENGRAFSHSMVDMLFAPAAGGALHQRVADHIDYINYHLRLGSGRGYLPPTPLFNCGVAVAHALFHAARLCSTEQGPVAGAASGTTVASHPPADASVTAPAFDSFFGDAVPPAAWNVPFHELGRQSWLILVALFFRLRCKSPLHLFERILDSARAHRWPALLCRSSLIGGDNPALRPGRPFRRR